MLGVKYTNTCLDEKREGEVFTLNIVSKYILLSGQVPSTFYEYQYVLKTTIAIIWLKLARFSAFKG